MEDESGAYANERTHKVQTQQVSLDEFLASSSQDRAAFEHNPIPERNPGPDGDVKQVIHHDTQRNDQRLPHFQPVDSRQNINTIRRKRAQ